MLYINMSEILENKNLGYRLIKEIYNEIGNSRLFIYKTIGSEIGFRFIYNTTGLEYKDIIDLNRDSYIKFFFDIFQYIIDNIDKEYDLKSQKVEKLLERLINEISDGESIKNLKECNLIYDVEDLSFKNKIIDLYQKIVNLGIDKDIKKMGISNSIDCEGIITIKNSNNKIIFLVREEINNKKDIIEFDSDTYIIKYVFIPRNEELNNYNPIFLENEFSITPILKGIWIKKVYYNTEIVQYIKSFIKNTKKLLEGDIELEVLKELYGEEGLNKMDLMIKKYTKIEKII